MRLDQALGSSRRRRCTYRYGHRAPWRTCQTLERLDLATSLAPFDETTGDERRHAHLRSRAPAIEIGWWWLLAHVREPRAQRARAFRFTGAAIPLDDSRASAAGVVVPRRCRRRRQARRSRRARRCGGGGRRSCGLCSRRPIRLARAHVRLARLFRCRRADAAARGRRHADDRERHAVWDRHGASIAIRATVTARCRHACASASCDRAHTGRPLWNKNRADDHRDADQPDPGRKARVCRRLRRIAHAGGEYAQRRVADPPSAARQPMVKTAPLIIETPARRDRRT